MKKALSVLADIVVILIVIFAVAIMVLVFSSTKNENGIPNLFGYAPLAVQTESMSGTFEKGDLIIVKTYEGDDRKNFEPGDVITFWKKAADETRFMDTHRIVETKYFAGAMYYTTKGDAFADDMLDLDPVPHYDVVGEWTGTKIANIGSAMDFLRSQKGFLICIVVPLAIFFFYEVYHLIVVLSERKKEKALADIAASEDDIKQKAVAEFLAQQVAAQNESAKAEQEQATEATQPAEQKENISEKKPEMSEEEKQRIIDEYLASQKQENKDNE